MKRLKTNRAIALLILVCLSLTSFGLFAQERELHSESDGFQWYKLKQNGKVGAQSMSGTTFIPLSRGYTFIYYHDTDGGWFSVEKDGKSGYGACDITGREIVAPGRYDMAYYRNDDGYEYCRVELNGKQGICDMNGREIIAPKYESLIYSNDGVFEYKNASGNWVSTGISLPKSSSTNYASTTTTTTSGGSSSSGSSSGSDKGKLLYEGWYNGGPSVLNGMSSPDVIGPYKVKIYENELDIITGGDTYYFTGTNNGKRKYSIYGNPNNSQNVFADLIVDDSYNLTLYRYHPVGTETKKYTRADSSPVNTTQGGYYGSGDNYGGYNNGSSGTNGGNSGNTQTSQPKQHKCGVCGGSGRVVKTDGPSFGNTKYCSECGRTVPDNHYHTTCPSCQGKGYW